VEAQIEIQNYLEQGRAALAQGQAREAAIAYAHGALLEPDNPIVQLGLAEANLALGNYAAVQVASRKVLELQLTNSVEAKIAQALLDLLDHCYERALQNVDAAVLQDPSIAYVHALRSYLLRATGQDYDATLARNTAMRRRELFSPPRAWASSVEGAASRGSPIITCPIRPAIDWKPDALRTLCCSQLVASQHLAPSISASALFLKPKPWFYDQCAAGYNGDLLHAWRR
jgi:tetratricopeptide (TPR) repeat protein